MRRAVLALLFFAFAAPAAAADATLDADAVRALLSGNTMDAETRLERFYGKKFHIHLRDDGTLTIVTFEGGRDTGTWEVTSGGLYCSQYRETRKGMRKCFVVRTHGDGHALVTNEGVVSSVFSVRAGNPDKL